MAHPLEPDQGGGRLSDDDAARLSEQIAVLTSAGLPLAPGLRATAEEMPRGRLRSTLRSVAAVIDRGGSVDDAVAAQGRRLPGHLGGLVRIGSRTGKISHVLGQFVAFTNVGVELRRKLWISMAYPALSLAIALGVFAFICSSIVPSFEAIFKDFGINLPLLTLVLLKISHLFALSLSAATEVAIGLVGLWLISYLFLSTPFRRSLVSGLPVIGAVWRNTSMAEFCHLLAILLECDVPLGEALRLTGQGVRDASLDRASAGMAADVEGGLTLSQALVRRPIFPRGLARVLSWAEAHQGLPESLRMAGEMFEARARSQAAVAGTVVAVVAVISILVGISSVVLGLLLPMVTLISRLSG